MDRVQFLLAASPNEFVLLRSLEVVTKSCTSVLSVIAFGGYNSEQNGAFLSILALVNWKDNHFLTHDHLSLPCMAQRTVWLTVEGYFSLCPCLLSPSS